jgi:hypothetical protein
MAVDILQRGWCELAPNAFYCYRRNSLNHLKYWILATRTVHRSFKLASPSFACCLSPILSPPFCVSILLRSIGTFPGTVARSRVVLDVKGFCAGGVGRNPEAPLALQEGLRKPIEQVLLGRDNDVQSIVFW